MFNLTRVSERKEDQEKEEEDDEVMRWSLTI